MGILDLSAEAEIYFIDNWTETPLSSIQFPDRQFKTDGLDKYIELNFAPTLNTLIGVNGTTQGRTEYSGITIVNCYHKTKKLGLDLADKTGEFLNGVELPLNIRLGTPQYEPPLDMGNDFWMIRVTVEINQC